MVIFGSIFKGKSQKGNDYFQVKLFEKRQSQDGEIYFADVVLFVDEPVYNKIIKKGFSFGDVVEVETAAPKYIGGKESLSDLTIVSESPYFD